MLAGVLGLNRTLGPVNAIGIAIVLLASLTLLPAVLAVAGERAFWPARPDAAEKVGGVWQRLGERVRRRPLPWLAAVVLLLGAGAGGHLDLRAAHGLVPAVQERDGRHPRVRRAADRLPAGCAGADDGAARAQRRAGGGRRRRRRAAACCAPSPASPRSPTSSAAPTDGRAATLVADVRGRPLRQSRACCGWTTSGPRSRRRGRACASLLAEGHGAAGRLPRGGRPRRQGDRADRARGRAADADRAPAGARRAARSCSRR